MSVPHLWKMALCPLVALLATSALSLADLSSDCTGAVVLAPGQTITETISNGAARDFDWFKVTVPAKTGLQVIADGAPMLNIWMQIHQQCGGTVIQERNVHSIGGLEYFSFANQAETSRDFYIKVGGSITSGTNTNVQGTETYTIAYLEMPNDTPELRVNLSKEIYKGAELFDPYLIIYGAADGDWKQNTYDTQFYCAVELYGSFYFAPYFEQIPVLLTSQIGEVATSEAYYTYKPLTFRVPRGFTGGPFWLYAIALDKNTKKLSNLGSVPFTFVE